MDHEAEEDGSGNVLVQRNYKIKLHTKDEWVRILYFCRHASGTRVFVTALIANIIVHRAKLWQPPNTKLKMSQRGMDILWKRPGTNLLQACVLSPVLFVQPHPLW